MDVLPGAENDMGKGHETQERLLMNIPASHLHRIEGT